MNGELAIGEFGTFDVENYGDLLYPILFERLFEKRNATAKIRQFSFMGSESLRNSDFNSRPVRRLFSSRRESLHTLIIGGGDLLHTDWHRVASHYHSTGISQKRQPLLSALQWRFKQCLNRRLNDTDKFRHQYMNYPAAGPFIIDPDRCSHLKSIAYCSCGVPFPFETDVGRHVAAALNKSAFIYVRDRQSQHALLQAGVTRAIHVAPDLAVALSDFFDPALERKKGRRILWRNDVALEHPILCVQSNPQPPDSTAELTRQLLACKERTGCEIVLLPLGRCHGDDEYLQALAHASDGEFKYLHLESIFDLISVLAACDIFIGTSLHGNITAFSFGIPFLFGPIPVRKSEGFLDIVNLPPELKLNSWSELNQKLTLLTTLDETYFTTRAAAAKQRVNQVFDLLVQTVTNTPQLAQEQLTNHNCALT
jgi:hypothetical protein